MHAGIVEHHHGEGVRILLDHKLVKRFYDRFRGRLMFPIKDDSGRVVGFSARVITAEKDAPKYINSPQTIVYDKSRVLYGLDLAKRSIMQHRRVYLVEGQADVIAMHQAGFTSTVASSGTALTPEQCRSLKRYADLVVLVFDADSAGQMAMTRGIELVLAAGQDVRCVVLPEGEDPDSVIQGQGTEAMQTLLDSAVPWMEYQTERFRSMGAIDDPVQQADAVRTMLSWIIAIPDALRHPFLIRELGERSSIDERTLQTEYERLQRSAKKAPYQTTRQEPPQRPAGASPATRSVSPAGAVAGASMAPPLLPPERELLRTALTVEHGLALILHQYRIDESTFYTERGQALFKHIIVAEMETHDVVGHLLEDPELPDHDKDLIRSIVGSAVQLSVKWKDFDVQIPDPDTARSVRDALLGIALQRTVAEIEVIMQMLQDAAEDEESAPLAHKLQRLMDRREELRRRYTDDPLDLTWLDADTTSAS